MRVPDRVIAIGASVMEGTHRSLLRITEGRFPHRLGQMQLLELHTIGRKSGQRRPTLLSSPIYRHDRVVLVASKGGYQEHPIWYKNLAANPAVEITIAGKTWPMVARTATPAERAELWPRIVKHYPNYASYQRNTSRQIPVVICEQPHDPGGPESTRA